MFACGKRALFAAALSALAMPVIASADQATDQKVKELEAKVAALESRQASDSRDVATAIDSVLRDAERRSQLLQNSANMGAGYDNGFFISAGEGWSLRPGVLFQFWNVTNFAEEADADGDDEIENGFEVHRLEFGLEGTAFTRDLQYAFVWDTGNTTGNLTLLDAFVRYMFADDWGFRAGQFKTPVHHEFLVHDGRLLAAERSLADQILSGGITDRTQGVSLIYGGYSNDNPINLELAYHDGFNTDNTDFQDDSGADFGVGGRVEWKGSGMWRDYNDFTAMGTSENLVVVGLGADWTQFGDGDIYHAALDLQWETSGGLGIYVAGLLQYLTDDALGATDDGTNWGLVAQGNYLLNPAWELFLRYGFMDVDEDAGFTFGDNDELHEITLGLNYYMGNNGSAGHRAKVTVDLTWLPDGATGGQTYRGFLDSENDQWVVRGQFQLWI